jgi:glycosyltransferase
MPLINSVFLLPKISVITVVRNGRPFIEQTLRSVLSQQYPNLEYIVIDGGSSDGTVDIIQAHKQGITQWLSEKDEGIADAFNKGLVLATGEYILFLNADDALANPQVLENIAQQIVNSGFPSIIYGDCDVLERDSGNLLYRASIPYSADGLLAGQMLPHPSLFAGRSYFEKYGNFDGRFRIAMDFEWLLRGALKERVVHVPVLVSNVRTGGVSTQNQHQAVDEIILALKKNGYIESGWAELKMRAYFRARAYAKYILVGLGLYKIFARVRNKS